MSWSTSCEVCSHRFTSWGIRLNRTDTVRTPSGFRSNGEGVDVCGLRTSISAASLRPGTVRTRTWSVFGRIARETK